ncbi:hypothetical protein H8356DRAFT_1325278 [Neocallimastix lanati (nom. inval.)]|nr:hypothetical protein H8356DRAFT_1325278 [Neocallimastix sp. JGI-2020a]
MVVTGASSGLGKSTAKLNIDNAIGKCYFKLDEKDIEKIFMEIPNLLTKYNGKFLNQFIQNEETNTAGKEVLLTIFILIQDSIVFT